MPELAAIRPKTLRPRHYLTVATIALVVIGCLAVLSAADGAATGSAFGYFAKALGFGVTGCAVMLALGRGWPRGRGGVALVHRISTVLLVAGFVGVVFVMLPTPITPTINGAKRWIVLGGGITVQPAELLKLALVLHVATVLTRDQWRKDSLKDLAPVLTVVLFALALIAHQDLGSGVVTAAVVATILFIGGVSGKHLGTLAGAACAGAAMLIVMAPERVERLTVFLDPWADRFDGGFQITNGLLAIGSGGVFGNGVGESLQKHIIPEPQTDFILPVIMEEVGLLGASLIFFLYLWIVWLGLKIARQTADPYERLVAVGLSAIVLWQSALNIFVVLGAAPLTGVPLPLISAGSTSQLILLSLVGLLIDIDRRSATPTVALVTPARRPRARRPAVSAPEPLPGELRLVDRRLRAPNPPAPAPAPGGGRTRMSDGEIISAARLRRPGDRARRER